MVTNLESKIFEIMFKLQGFFCTDIYIESELEISKQRIVLEAESTHSLLCANCKSTKVKKYDRTPRYILIGSILHQPIYIKYWSYRLQCLECGKILTQEQNISNGKRTYSKAFAESLIFYTQRLDNKSASEILGITHTKVYRIDKEVLSAMGNEKSSRSYYK